MYLQRYLSHFPRGRRSRDSSIEAGTTARASSTSWGSAQKEEHRHFLKVCPSVENFVTDHGVQLIKYWLEVSDKEQKRRFEARLPTRSASGNSAHRPAFAKALV
jgi:polyphosphate kinase 2 (PPK2 family)